METKNTIFLIAFAILMLILLSGCSTNFLGCTEEAKICPDGTAVGRRASMSCEFEACPEIQTCNTRTQCPENMSCYKFPDNDKPYCHFGDPCLECASGKCRILKSFPAKVVCE